MGQSTVAEDGDVARIGEIINGRYRVGEIVGRGGMGCVYRAEHIGLGRTVAIKVLDPVHQAPYAAERFVREARETAALRHPNIVDVLDYGELHDGSPFLVMEFLDGEDLGSILSTEGSLPWPRARYYLEQICSALAYTHENGLVHRDLKLENCIVVRENGLERVKIVDFGIAKSMRPTNTRLTSTGAAIGTPEYMSPEQCRGIDVDHRTDVYSLGVIGYELLTGVPPFTGDDAIGVLVQHLNDPVPPPSVRNPSIPRPAEAVLMQALAKDKNQRTPSMAAFLAGLQHVDVSMSGPILVDVPSGPIQTLSASGSRRTPVAASTGPRAWAVGAAVAGVLAAFVGATAAAWWLLRPAETPEVSASVAEAAVDEAGHDKELVAETRDEVPGSGPGPSAAAEAVAEDAAGVEGVDATPDAANVDSQEPPVGDEPSSVPNAEPVAANQAPRSRPKGLDAKAAKAALERIRPYFRTCRGKVVGGTAGEKVRLKLRVAASSGKVVGARALGSHRNTKVGQCAADAAGHARLQPFGTGSGSVVVTFAL